MENEIKVFIEKFETDLKNLGYDAAVESLFARMVKEGVVELVGIGEHQIYLNIAAAIGFLPKIVRHEKDTRKNKKSKDYGFTKTATTITMAKRAAQAFFTENPGYTLVIPTGTTKGNAMGKRAHDFLTFIQRGPEEERGNKPADYEILFYDSNDGEGLKKIGKKLASKFHHPNRLQMYSDAIHSRTNVAEKDDDVQKCSHYTYLELYLILKYNKNPFDRGVVKRPIK